MLAGRGILSAPCLFPPWQAAIAVATLDSAGLPGQSGCVSALLDQLHSTFGYTAFRGVQPQVIDRVMAGERTLAVMPTGAGKSLCYQLPSVALEGTAIVISPLIALMHDQVRAADAVLIVTPEYNFSIPGVLKNTLDWLSRPPEPPFDGKTVAIMGASPGPVGTARVQYHMRQVMVFMNAFVVNKPEVFISNCAGKFNEQGELTDETTAKFIGELLVSLQKLKTRVG